MQHTHTTHPAGAFSALERTQYIDWCLALGLIDQAIYHFQMIWPSDLAPLEFEGLFRKMRLTRASGLPQRQPLENPHVACAPEKKRRRK